MVVSLLKSETTDPQSPSESKTISNAPFDPNSTKWSNINLFKFGALVAVSSTIENAIFYPYVTYFSLELFLFYLFSKKK
jgi:hypothetical protein